MNAFVAILRNNNTLKASAETAHLIQQQQQQQHSLLSQASWGRLEMKPKRDEKQGDTKRDINGTRQKDITVQAR
jgi:hypothetical protein